MSQLDVAAEMLVQRRSGELVNRLRDILTGSLDGDVVVLLEVDTSVLLGRIVDGSTIQFTFDTGVSRSGNVLSITPLAIARASGRVIATTTTTSGVTLVATTRVTTSTTAPAAAAVILEGRGRSSTVGARAVPVVRATSEVSVGSVTTNFVC